MKPSPALTFVVIPLIGAADLERCVAQLSRMQAAIIVVGRGTAALAERATVVVIESDATVPIRRALGAAEAKTEWVAFVEDTCEIGAQWYAAFKALACEPGCRAWGGPIDIAADLPARCAALASLEYGEFAPHRWHQLATGPGSEWRPVRRLAGLCLLYRSEVLGAHGSGEGLLLETQLNERLLAAGEPLALHRGLAVRYAAMDLAGARLSSRYAHGRIYGGGRRMKQDWRERAFSFAKCALLPLVLMVRGIAGLPPARRRSAITLGWLLGFAGAWSAGEAMGLLFGRGASLGAWR